MFVLLHQEPGVVDADLFAVIDVRDPVRQNISATPQGCSF